MLQLLMMIKMKIKAMSKLLYLSKLITHVKVNINY